MRPLPRDQGVTMATRQRRRGFFARRSRLGAPIALLGILSLLTASMTVLFEQPANAQAKIFICHVTNSLSNPWSLIEIDVSAWDPTGQDQNSHGPHHTSTKGNPPITWSDYGPVDPAVGCDPSVNGSITIVKDAVPDDPAVFSFSGTWSFTLSDPADNTEVILDLKPQVNTYTVTEAALGGWDLTGLSCPGATNAIIDLANRTATIVLDVREDVTCTFTNTKQLGSVTLVKIVVNDDGGTLGVADFPLFITPAGGGPAIPATSGVPVTLDAGDYIVSETEDPGYAASGWGGDCAADGSITVALGGTYSCTITNDDDPGVPATTTTTTVSALTLITTTTAPTTTTTIAPPTELPVTGGGPGNFAALLLAGLGLILLGAGMVLMAARPRDEQWGTAI